MARALINHKLKPVKAESIQWHEVEGGRGERSKGRV